MRFNRVVVGALTAAALLALSAHAQDPGAKPAPAAGAPGDMAALMTTGEDLFLVNCRQCHGSKGTAGAPLAKNGKLEDAAFVARTIITGPGYMTAFGDHLSDDEIAAIATFVRNSWGNAYGSVDAAAVAGER